MVATDANSMFKRYNMIGKSVTATIIACQVVSLLLPSCQLNPGPVSFGSDGPVADVRTDTSAKEGRLLDMEVRPFDAETVEIAEVTETDACKPKCGGKECGPNGCGGNCGECTEFPNSTCDEVAGKCGCDKSCGSKECGDDGCGGSCGECTEHPASYCSEVFHTCECEPECPNKECGPNGCGGSCGDCSEKDCEGQSAYCNTDEATGAAICQCDCDSNCEEEGAQQCAADSGYQKCELVEGTDDCHQWKEHSCKEGQSCVPATGVCCTPHCDGKECGNDDCGGSCGKCEPPATCSNGSCLCIPDCEGKKCGPDACGGTCGECPPTHTCVGGICFCTPDCSDKECGDDGCGGFCSSEDGGDTLGCSDGLFCTADNKCVEAVVPVDKGDVVITEFMAKSIAGKDKGEWFELYNATGKPLELAGCFLKDLELEDEQEEKWHKIGFDGEPASVIVNHGQFVVLARSLEEEENHGLTPDYVYQDDLKLKNKGEEKIILSCGQGQLIDEVKFNKNWKIDDNTGFSLQLEPSIIDQNTGPELADLNNQKAKWCLPPPNQIYGTAGKLGTPGEMNSCEQDLVDP